MSQIKIRLHMQGWAEVSLDEDAYREASYNHLDQNGSNALDRLLRDAISGMDTEVTVTEPDGTEYDL